MRDREEVLVASDAAAVVKAAALRLVASARSAIADRGEFRLGLTGGAVPERLYGLLATPAMIPTVDWSRATFLFSDENDAPPTEPESHYWIARKLLLEPVGALPERIHRMRGETADLEAAALEYEAWLEKPLDLLLLDVGRDGHTASLFPGSPVVHERVRRVAAIEDSPRLPRRRLTMTPRAIGEARTVLVLVAGADRAAAVAKALDGDDDLEAVPARLLRGATWLLDRDAAGGLALRT